MIKWACTVALWAAGTFLGLLLMMGGDVLSPPILTLAFIVWLASVIWGARCHQGKAYWILLIGSAISLIVGPILWPLLYALMTLLH